MAVKLLTFLGTNNYLECNYYLGRDKINNCRFVQSAIVQLFRKNYQTDFSVVVFTTSNAKESNWKTPNKNNKLGLYETLSQLELDCSIKQVDIPEGKNTDELWQIFEKVLKEIDEKDDIIFDITHGFRSLPILVIIIINYAKLLKKIQLRGIYYGAIEFLGVRKYIEGLPIEQRNVPIFDLTPFISLFDWTIGIERFISSGDASFLSQLAKQEIRPIQISSKGQDKTARTIKNFVESLNNFTETISTCRGTKIAESIKKIKENLNNHQLSDNLLIQMKPILKKIEEKFQLFSDNEEINQLQSVWWCIEHNQIQQGFTLLQEFIISFLCRKNGYNPLKRDDRKFVSACISIVGRNIPPEDWSKEIPQTRENEIKKLQKNINGNLAKIYCNIPEYRNDLNHAGYTQQPHDAKDFKNKLKEILNEVQELIKTL